MKNTLLTSAERTATTVSEDQNTPAGQRGITVVLDVTKAPAAADTLALSIELRDPASGKYVPLTGFAASKKGEELEAGATLAFTLYPGAAETAALGGHEVMALPLPQKWRVKVTHSAAGKWTYSVGASSLR
jgi:hypothetical protein